MADRTPRPCPECGTDYTKSEGPGRWPGACPACLPGYNRRRHAERDRVRQKTRPSKKPDTPCSGCGTLLYTTRTSLPPDRIMCRPCRAQRRPPPWQPHEAKCSGCRQPMWMEKATRRYCDTCRIEYRRTHPRSPRSRVDTPSRLKRIGRPRRTACAKVRASEPNCHLCGLPIDLTLDRQRHPLASSVDELIPVAHGGSTTDRANLRHAHRVCNGSRGTKAITPEVRARCRHLVTQILEAAQATIRPI